MIVIGSNTSDNGQSCFTEIVINQAAKNWQIINMWKQQKSQLRTEHCQSSYARGGGEGGRGYSG